MTSIIKSKSKVKDERCRNWAFVAYPESMPENWKAILTDLNLCWSCSPLHDKDYNETAEGGKEPKKAHYHFVLKFSGNKSFEQIKEITDKLNATIPQKVANIVGAVRYYCHLDNPEKAPYKVEDIQEGGGFDIESILKLTPAQERAILNDIVKFARSNGVVELFDLVNYCIDEREEWLPVVYARHTFLTSYLRSARYINEKLAMTSEA